MPRCNLIFTIRQEYKIIGTTLNTSTFTNSEWHICVASKVIMTSSVTTGDSTCWFIYVYNTFANTIGYLTFLRITTDRITDFLFFENIINKFLISDIIGGSFVRGTCGVKFMTTPTFCSFIQLPLLMIRSISRNIFDALNQRFVMLKFTGNKIETQLLFCTDYKQTFSLLCITIITI